MFKTSWLHVGFPWSVTNGVVGWVLLFRLEFLVWFCLFAVVFGITGTRRLLWFPVWFSVLRCSGVLMGCVADLGKPLFHVWNSVNPCCFSVRSTDSAGNFLSRSICAGLSRNSQYLFWLFSFWFRVSVCFWFAELLWVAAGCAWRISDNYVCGEVLCMA